MTGYINDEDALLARLAWIEGQLRGLARMVERDTHCIDVLTQVSTTTGSQSLALELLDDHLTHCVTEAAGQGGVQPQAKLSEASAAIARLVES